MVKKIVKKDEITQEVEPLGEFLLVKVIKTAATESGIVLPESIKDPSETFKVVKVGKAVKNGIKKGDVVLFAGGAKLINFEHHKHVAPDIYIIHSQNIFGLLKDKKK